MRPTFFATRRELRAWLDEHHDTSSELWVGLYKKSSGHPSVTWPEVVDEALCFGWIDGIRRGIDEQSYMNRITPRKANSNWSEVNIRRVQELTKQRRMRAAGQKAFRERRKAPASVPAYEQRYTVKLDAASERRFRAEKEAWRWFRGQPDGYQASARLWVMSAKKPETRERRLTTLIEDSAKGRRVPPLRPRRTGGRPLEVRA
jgi:uncharacterized protein YdeI (YjbR/CyaY-like superfamily)